MRVAASAFVRRRRDGPSVFYGGARAGEVGGTLVKVQRLQSYFPEDRLRFNIVYGLSNAPYLAPAALDILRKRGIPLVINQNGVFYPGWYPTGWQNMNRTMAHGYHRADHVFWQSEFCRRAADKYLGPRSGPGEILNNAIDLTRFKPSVRSATDTPQVLMSGKFDAERFYRLESAIAGIAAAHRQGIKCNLRVAGKMTPGCRATFDRHVAKAGIGNHVSFTGPYTQAEAPQIYAEADIYLTTAHMDPCPNAVIEALASGLPVIHTSTGGPPELVGPDAGVQLETAEDFSDVSTPRATDIASALETALSERLNMSRAARYRAEERFDITNWIRRHQDVFERLTGE